MNDDLKHEYASEYYDPQKAHDYYMKNRELKGKRKASDLSKSSREVWSVAKSNIDAQKKGETKKESEKHKAEMQKLRASANVKKEQIKTKLQSLIDSINSRHASLKEQAIANRTRQLDEIKAKTKASVERLQKEAWDRVVNLPPLGKNPSEAEVAAREKEVLLIIKEYKGKIGSVTKQSKQDARVVRENNPIPKKDTSQTAQLSETKKQQLLAAGAELKKSVESSKSKYESLKKNLKDKYETIYQREFDAIKDKA